LGPPGGVAGASPPGAGLFSGGRDGGGLDPIPACGSVGVGVTDAGASTSGGMGVPAVMSSADAPDPAAEQADRISGAAYQQVGRRRHVGSLSIGFALLVMSGSAPREGCKKTAFHPRTKRPPTMNRPPKPETKGRASRSVGSRQPVHLQKVPHHLARRQRCRLRAHDEAGKQADVYPAGPGVPATGDGA
jgi:hypothetical protein